MSVIRTIIFFAFALVAAFPLSAHALGVSPGSIQVQHMMTSSTLEKVLNISNARSGAAQTFSITLRGDAAQLLTVEDSVTLAAGEQAIQVPITITSQAVTGTFKGDIIVALADEPIKDVVGTIVTVQVAIPISITVTDEKMRAFSITDVTLSDRDDNNVLAVSFLATNKGNIPEPIESVTVSLERTDITGQTIIVQELTLPDTIVPPSTKQSINLTLAEPVPTGRYHADVQITYDGAIQHTRNGIALQVGSATGGVNTMQSGAAMNASAASLEKKRVVLIPIYLAGMIITLIALAYFYKKTRE